jgi:DNA-binding NarL/FixJ family response regulator
MPFGEPAKVCLGDQRPFFRAKEPEQALSLRISKPSSVHGLRIYGICHAGKRSAGSELFHAIAEALKGRSYVTKQIARGMQESFVRDPQPKERVKVPTSRQREVIQLVAEGKPMKQIADVLNVTPRTVAFHKYRAMEWMGCKTTAELIQFAVKNNIVGMA